MRQSHRVPIPLLLCVKLFLLFAAFLAIRSIANLRFSEEVLIYDLIWLDAWALAFVAVLVAAWYSPVSKTVRAWIMMSIFLIAVMPGSRAALSSMSRPKTS